MTRINDKKLLKLINRCLLATTEFTRKYYKSNSMPDTLKILNEFKKEISKNPENINERILRGCHDLGMSSYKVYENSTLETAIDDLISELWNTIPRYRKLKPLGKDFGKGDPI